NAIIGCDIYATGEGGIYLGGGDRRTLSRGDNAAINNHIHDFNRWVYTYRPAISIDGVGNHVSHNLIDDAPHAGIFIHGNDHVVDLNELHHLCLQTSDAGAIYMGRDLSERGNVIRYNFIHDLGKNIDDNAIYLDDLA